MILLAASSGGHLHQLNMIAVRSQANQLRWVSDKTAMSESILADEDVVWVPEIIPRRLFRALRALPRIYKAMHGCSGAVSTGASVAVPTALAAVIRRVPFIYIESATRADGPSLTGRLLEFIPGVSLYTQYASWGRRRWIYLGNLFDGFLPSTHTPTASLDGLRICVTVGASRQYGLKDQLERLQSSLPSSAKVVWQYGPAAVNPTQFAGRPEMTFQEVASEMSRADVVIAHAGTGSLLASLAANRIPLLCPRRRSSGEHVDDHQFLTAKIASERGLALVGDFASVSSGQLLELAGARVDYDSGVAQRMWERVLREHPLQ